MIVLEFKYPGEEFRTEKQFARNNSSSLCVAARDYKQLLKRLNKNYGNRNTHAVRLLVDGQAVPALSVEIASELGQGQGEWTAEQLLTLC